MTFPTSAGVAVPCPVCEYDLQGLPLVHRCPECGFAYDRNARGARPVALGASDRLSRFDKVCGVLAAIIAAAFVLMGVFGTFVGTSASFTLPAIVGVLPALVGWGILKSVIVAWRCTQRERAMRLPPRRPAPIYRDPIPRTSDDVDRDVERLGEPPP
ncbi:MAG TPA: hypothetical protein VGR35_16625 [Tepidisphaeraceae bacterium]|nr:hypothetical protein [Tepidisphaeraceae bacterium]